MSTRARQFAATVIRKEQVSEHLIRIVLGGGDLDAFESTGIADEWVGLIVPGQFQSRYYTVADWREQEVTLDVVVHEQGLVTEWVAQDCTDDTVTLTEPKGSFAPPDDASWLVLVGDLTAMPAMARALAQTEIPDVRVVAEVADDLPGYLPHRAGVDITWTAPPAHGESALAAVVESMDLPDGPGYFWMAGESAQMRAIRKHLMRERKLPAESYDVMGYWRGGGAKRQPRPVDPGPVYRAGKAAGKSDEEIWADYDALRD